MELVNTYLNSRQVSFNFSISRNAQISSAKSHASSKVVALDLCLGKLVSDWLAIYQHVHDLSYLDAIVAVASVFEVQTGEDQLRVLDMQQVTTLKIFL